MKTRAAEIKGEMWAMLQARYPDSFRQFTLRSRSWSTGGSVDVEWIDGPSEDKVKALFRSLADRTSISIGMERRYTISFLSYVVSEYCQAKRCDMPSIEIHPDGSAWMDNDYSKDIPYRDIFRELQSLDVQELASLTYRECHVADPHGYGCSYVVCRAWIVRRRDYSHGKYHGLAICRDKSYTSYMRKLFQVRRRISQNWVEVVDGTSLCFMDNTLALDDYHAKMSFQQPC